VAAYPNRFAVAQPAYFLNGTMLAQQRCVQRLYLDFVKVNTHSKGYFRASMSCLRA
jgi:hypothetical protein